MPLATFLEIADTAFHKTTCATKFAALRTLAAISKLHRFRSPELMPVPDRSIGFDCLINLQSVDL